MCGRLLRKVPLFQNRDENFINVLLLKLDYEVFLEGDVIIQRNVPGDRMFFIDHGQAVMETESEERELCDGDFFGGRWIFLRSLCVSEIPVLHRYLLFRKDWSFTSAFNIYTTFSVPP